MGGRARAKKEERSIFPLAFIWHRHPSAKATPLPAYFIPLAEDATP
jgi:hypothetical protein